MLNYGVLSVKGVNNTVQIASLQKHQNCDKAALLAEQIKKTEGALMYHNECGTCVKFIFSLFRRQR